MVQSATAGARRTAPLRGDNVRLRAVEEGDLPLLVRWMNDPEVRYWLHHSDRPDATVESVRGRFGLTEERFPNLVWLIETLEGRPVGHLALLQMDPHHKRAEGDIDRREGLLEPRIRHGCDPDGSAARLRGARATAG